MPFLTAEEVGVLRRYVGWVVTPAQAMLDGVWELSWERIVFGAIQKLLIEVQGGMRDCKGWLFHVLSLTYHWLG